jgi:hypothetical protein
VRCVSVSLSEVSSACNGVEVFPYSLVVKDVERKNSRVLSIRVTGAAWPRRESVYQFRSVAQTAGNPVHGLVSDKFLQVPHMLLYIDQYRRNINIVGEQVDQDRVTLTMVRIGHDWKVSSASAI